GRIGPAQWSCRSDESPLPRGNSVTRIALIGISQDHPTWPVIQATARLLGGRRGRLEIIVDAPQTPSTHQQQAILAGLGNDRADAVCINPLEAGAMAPTI